MTNEQLVLRIKSGENTAENMLQLYEQNRGMIYQVARKYSEYAEIDDLMQEGYLALCEAVCHYNADYGAQFITYAMFWIKQGMLRYIETCGSLVRIPNYARQLILKYKKIYGEYKKWYGREPSDKEMRAFLRVDQQKLEDIQKCLKMDDIQSLSKPIGGEDEDILLVDMVSSEQDLEEDICRKLDYEIMQKALWNTVDDLPEQEASVIRMRYQDRLTLKETGEQLGVSFQRTRNIESSALRKLRLPHKNKGYRDYFEQYISASPIYHVGVSRFSSTWTSATEELALRRYRRTFENDTEMILEKYR